MKIKFINGPLHGLEREEKDDRPHYDLLEKSTGKVRRYAKSDTVFFVKEWANIEEYKKEVLGDNPTRSGQLGEVDARPAPGSKEHRDT